MNNMMGLDIFLLLAYIRELSWDSSSFFIIFFIFIFYVDDCIMNTYLRNCRCQTFSNYLTILNIF